MVLKWIETDRKTINKAYVFYHVQAERHSPTTKSQGTFDLLLMPNWIQIIPTTKDNKIIFVKQYRHGIDDITLELPGGGVEKGEAFIPAAQRELLEETGYTSNNWQEIGKIHPNPAFMNNWCGICWAKDCIQTTKQNLDELEEIDIVSFSKDEIPQLIQNGTITHSLTIASFYFLEKLL